VFPVVDLMVMVMEDLGLSSEAHENIAMHLYGASYELYSALGVTERLCTRWKYEGPRLYVYHRMFGPLSTAPSALVVGIIRIQVINEKNKFAFLCILLLLLLLLSPSSSSLLLLLLLLLLSSSSSPLCRVFILTFLRQIMSLQHSVSMRLQRTRTLIN